MNFDLMCCTALRADMIRKLKLGLLAALLWPAIATAQSTATPVVTGYLASSGCSYGQTTCFVQYGAGGGGGGGGGGAITVANGADTAEGSTTDTAYAGSGAASVISLLKGIYSNGGGGGGGGAVTAASGAYALGSIVDIGTGASPGANTVNGHLASLITALGTPFQAGGSIGNTSFIATGSAAQGSPPSGNPVPVSGWDGTNTRMLTTNTSGDLVVVGALTGGVVGVMGNVASAATDSGNPIKIGGVYNTTMPTFTTGQRGDLQLTARGAAQVTLYTGSGAAMTGAQSTANSLSVVPATSSTWSNGSQGTPGSAVPSLATAVAGKDESGNTQNILTDTTGALAAPIAGTANRVVTKTSVAANTSTTVCPTATNPSTTEIQVQTGSIGLGINGQALTSATFGTGTTAPDIVLSSAGAFYTFPVAPTNIVTAYGSAQIVTCIQTLRQ